MTDSPVSKRSASPFLTVRELAELLHVNQKKIYQLAGDGELPGTKITGKWIFPRSLIEDWIIENSHGGVMSDRLLLAGSDDQLIHQVCDIAAIELQKTALISYSPCGTRHGLQMLDLKRIDACFINWGASESIPRRHLGLLRSYKNHADWVIVRCLQRRQGLIVRPGIDLSNQTAENLIKNKRLNWALRHDDSGTYRLLEDICNQYHYSYQSLQANTVSNSERSAVISVSTGHSDITSGVECSAREHNLQFVPLADISIDLVTSKRTYFRTLLQEFLHRLKGGEAFAIADALHGYRLHEQQEVLSLQA